MVQRSAQALWMDYRFLTKEMLKFVSQTPDQELFDELLEQRDKLQLLIEQTPDRDYKTSAEGQSLCQEVQEINEAIRFHLQQRRNQIKIHHQVSEAYDSLGANVEVSRRSWER